MLHTTLSSIYKAVIRTKIYNSKNKKSSMKQQYNLILHCNVNCMCVYMHVCQEMSGTSWVLVVAPLNGVEES